MDIKIDPEFRALIPPLADHERDQLEANLLNDGCREPLVVWLEENILLDGHNRMEMCRRCNIDFQVRSLTLPDRNAAKVWIIRNQFGRRNLSPYTRAELALKLEPLIAEKAKEHQVQGGKKKVIQKSGEPPIRTDKQLAKVASISHDTIAKAKVIAEKAPEPVKESLRHGDISINKAYQDIRREERKATTVARERDALADADTASTDWEVAADQTVVRCQALITDPPYGILDEPWEPDKLESFTKEWLARWNECQADFIVSFWSQRYLWLGKTWFDESLTNYGFQQLLVWHYRNNKSPQSRTGFKQTWEPILFYRRNDSPALIRVSGAEWGEDLHDFDCHVAAVPQSNFNNAEMKQHPAQKPVSVMRWLINALTQPGDIVCDPFCGSGTTGIAAIQLHRRFHGIETSAEFRELSSRRIGAYGAGV